MAAAAVNRTQCTATVETVTQARFWGSTGGRGDFTGVGRISAQLLTCVTGESIYAPTADAQTTVVPTDLPLSEARIAAVSAGTLDASRELPVETQGVSMTDTTTLAAATSEDADTAALSSVLAHVSLDSDLQVLQEGSRSTRTKHQLGSLTLPMTSPQLGQVDIKKIILAVGSVSSGPHLAQSIPQVTVPRPRDKESSNFEPANVEYTNADDDIKDIPPHTQAQRLHPAEWFCPVILRRRHSGRLKITITTPQ